MESSAVLFSQRPPRALPLPIISYLLLSPRLSLTDLLGPLPENETALGSGSGGWNLPGTPTNRGAAAPLQPPPPEALAVGLNGLAIGPRSNSSDDSSGGESAPPPPPPLSSSSSPAQAASPGHLDPGAAHHRSLGAFRHPSWRTGRPAGAGALPSPLGLPGGRERSFSLASSGGGGGSARSDTSAGTAPPGVHWGSGMQRWGGAAAGPPGSSSGARSAVSSFVRACSRSGSLASTLSGDILAAINSALEGEPPGADGLERVKEGLASVALYEPNLASELSEHVSYPRHRVTAAWLQGTLLLPADAEGGGPGAGGRPWGGPDTVTCAAPLAAEPIGGADLAEWCPAEAAALLAGVETQAALAVLRARGEAAWAFDAMALGRATGGKPLAVLGLVLLREHGFLGKNGITAPASLVGLDAAACWAGLTSVEVEYKDNPYHCNEHAADVLWSVHCLLTQGGILEAGVSDPLEILAILLAAAIHDVGHPGLNNAFLTATEHPLAIAHNDTSVLERHHLSLGWSVLTSPQGGQPALLSPLARDDRLRLRRILIALVLNTDLRTHFDGLASFQERFSFAPEPSSSLTEAPGGGLPQSSPISSTNESLGSTLKGPNPFLLTSEDRLSALEMALKVDKQMGQPAFAC